MSSPPDDKRTKMRQSILLHPTKNEAALPLFDDEETITDPVIFDRVTLWGREEFQNSEVSANELQDLRALSEDSMGHSGFHRLCNSPRDPKLGQSDPRWQFLRVYLFQLMIDPSRGDSELRMQQREGHKYTPLHIVCMFSPPLDVVEDMIRLCPASLQMTTSNGDLRLGLAAGGFFSATPEVIGMLVEANPDAVTHRSKLGKTPLHNYLEACVDFKSVPSPCIIRLLIADD
eukprot:scaffold37768_cov137-Skeletonema_marinoi.AAC.1